MSARRLTILTLVAGVTLIGAPAWKRPGIRLIWNASASLPVGLYRVEPVDHLAVGDLAVVMPPEQLARFLDARHYLPKGLPLLKRVLALSGTTVCRIGNDISAYGVSWGQARERDHQGRVLPVWQGCRRLAKGEVFLMNPEAPDSLDGRYFGPLAVSSILGRAIPLWTFETPDPGAETSHGAVRSLDPTHSPTRKGPPQ